MRYRFALLVMAGFVAFGAACGDDDDDAATPDAGVPDAGTPDAAVDPVLDDICNETDGIYVQFFSTLFECRPEFEFFFNGDLPDDAALSALCEGSLSPFVDDGTVELGNAATFAACVDYVSTLTCEQADFDVSNPCDDLLVGTVALGNDCDSGDQCAGNAYCDGGLTGGLREGGLTGGLRGGVATCGTCTATKTNGSTCTGSNECASGYCDEDDEGPETCKDIGVLGDSCDEAADCLGTLVCDAATNECASEPTWAIGTDCVDFPFDCDGLTSNLFCHPGTLVCTAWLELGQTCDPEPTTAEPFCRLLDNHTCADVGGGTFECVAPTTAGLSEACGVFTGLECGDNLFCDDSVCKTLVQLGGDCSLATSGCATFLECIENVCQYGEHTGMCPTP